MYKQFPKVKNIPVVWILFSVFFLRLLFLLTNHLDLIGDETYYWDWSRQLDWCYYSKPPMIAWLIALATHFGGHNVEIVRLPAVLLGAIFLYYFYRTANSFYGPKAAMIALLMMLATPFSVLANLMMTIDPPLYCFWIMSLYYLHHALFTDQKSAWLLAGITTGLGILSKQVGLFIPLMLFIFLLLSKEKRCYFKREFWIYLLPVIACLLPILFWNQQHDWIMFTHSKGHFAIKESVSLVKHIEQGLIFLVFQLLLVSPILCALLFFLSAKSSWQIKNLEDKALFLVLMGPVLLLGISFLGFIQKVQGNWGIPFYFSALILLSQHTSQTSWSKYMKAGLATGFFMVSLTYTLPVLIQTLHLQNTAIDPTYRFRHTQSLVNAIALERQKLNAASENTFIIAVGHRFLVSQMAFYLPDHPFVFHFEESGQIISQYEVWPGPVDKIGKQALIVSDRDEAEIPNTLKAAFVNFQKKSEIVNPSNPTTHYTLFLADQLKYWPPHAENP
jgi:4-amino-4-deoxy-L-arabinose transferase-like glycosyltransferase